MNATVTIEISMLAPNVSEARLSNHLDYLIRGIKSYAEGEIRQDWIRKINTSWEEQENVDVELDISIQKP